MKLYVLDSCVIPMSMTLILYCYCWLRVKTKGITYYTFADVLFVFTEYLYMNITFAL